LFLRKKVFGWIIFTSLKWIYYRAKGNLITAKAIKICPGEGIGFLRVCIDVMFVES